MRIPVPKIVIAITAVFAAIIPTVVGALSWVSPTNAPLYIDGSHDIMLSWGARSLGLAMAGWLALLVLQDARAYVVALGANATREVLDLIDLLFCSLETSTGLYFMLPVSASSLIFALVLSIRAVRTHNNSVEPEPRVSA